MTEPTREQIRRDLMNHDKGRLTTIAAYCIGWRAALAAVAPPSAPTQIRVHNGRDGAWVEFWTQSGKSFCFQPVQQWPLTDGDMFATVASEWARDQQAMHDAAQDAAPPRLCDNVDQFGQECYLQKGHAGRHARVPPPTPAADDLVAYRVKILRDRDLGIAEFHALQLPLAGLIEQQAAEIARLTEQVATMERSHIAGGLATVVAERNEWKITAERAEDENAKLRGVVRGIVDTYDNYRRRGVAPAPAEYVDVVKAIDAAREPK